jgi:hypothetical protein
MVNIKKALVSMVEWLAVPLSIGAKSGSKAWLISTEKKYGGYVTGVPRGRVGAKDTRSVEEIRAGGMTGGDRMSSAHHGYAGVYEQYLRPFLGKPGVVVAEVGILKGTGLAIWSELFPDGRIIGLDIDLGNIRANMDNLKSHGAFSSGNLELHEYDQFVDNREMLAGILIGAKIDIFIDDGLHTPETIFRTFESMHSHLAEQFVYFIEDNATIHEEFRKMVPQYRVDHQGEMTVIYSLADSSPLSKVPAARVRNL